METKTVEIIFAYDNNTLTKHTFFFFCPSSITTWKGTWVMNLGNLEEVHNIQVRVGT
jgi:hypothetical protein